MLKEFKEFAMRGNVVDLAVGVIIGGAFGQIVGSFVNDVMMPPLGLLTGGVDFSDKMITLKQATENTPAVNLKYGVFVNTVINFLIIAFAIFMMIRGINRLKRKEEVPSAEPTTKECPECLMTIPLHAKRCGHCAVVLK
ncbi:MAG: large-conductance mechanosensitive channel protein MscL [candidate division KSB1 bacterium]|nr:large-conductance mechanosensitive channel protein MscL [candidate division KSB1 bacterium]MDZ7403031.1 large-conductance mechanosensitive channel protein MscL [candidate division KSB1 bacterium]